MPKEALQFNQGKIKDCRKGLRQSDFLYSFLRLSRAGDLRRFGVYATTIEGVINDFTHR
jgi:hypothetical protein